MASITHSKAQVLSLYKQLIKESRKFANYNYREYSLRKIRDTFRANKDVTSAETIEELVKKGEENLDLIKRQVTINQMYKTKPVILEGLKKS